MYGSLVQILIFFSSANFQTIHRQPHHPRLLEPPASYKFSCAFVTLLYKFQPVVFVCPCSTAYDASAPPEEPVVTVQTYSDFQEACAGSWPAWSFECRLEKHWRVIIPAPDATEG